MHKMAGIDKDINTKKGWKGTRKRWCCGKIRRCRVDRKHIYIINYVHSPPPPPPASWSSCQSEEQTNYRYGVRKHAQLPPPPKKNIK